MIRKKFSSGFTLVELLLGITISVLIFLTAGSVMATLYSSGTRTKQSQALEQTRNDLQLELLNAVRWSQNLSYTTNSITANESTYHVESERLYKNDVPLTSSEVIVKSFNITNYTASPPEASLEITTELGHRRFTTLNDVFKFVVSQRKTTIEEGKR